MTGFIRNNKSSIFLFYFYILFYIFMNSWVTSSSHKSCTCTSVHSLTPPGLLFLLSTSNNVLRGALEVAERRRWLISLFFFFFVRSVLSLNKDTITTFLTTCIFKQIYPILSHEWVEGICQIFTEGFTINNQCSVVFCSCCCHLLFITQQ